MQHLAWGHLRCRVRRRRRCMSPLPMRRSMRRRRRRPQRRPRRTLRARRWQPRRQCYHRRRRPARGLP